MKIKKKTPKKIDDLDSVIGSGKAVVEESVKRRPGRPKNKVKKVQCPFYLPNDLIEKINKNCRGNKSVFAEEVFKFYFDHKGIKN